MKIPQSIAGALLLFVCTVPAFAQPIGKSQPGDFRSDIRLQGWVFGNFFYTADDNLKQDVAAYRTELRSAWRPGERPMDVYTHVNYLVYDVSDRDPSYGLRLGVAEETEQQNFNFFIDRAENRASVDVGDRLAVANVTMLGGEYARRITEDWQLGGEFVHERQRFSIESDQENDYTGLTASVRYRGFGYKFSPTVGYGVGRRSSADDAEDTEDDHWFAQVAVIPHPRIYMSLRYRHGARDYLVDAPVSTNFRRHDDRPQWTFSSSVRVSDRVNGLVYFSRENMSSSVPNRDVETYYLILGVAIGL
ncbi:MAG TPA: hypothetical protein VEK57_02990 [Thermoanaerobaculia bacterium]|nr:hypothetical protein [Thermoanaerobaculia bacterium]